MARKDSKGRNLRVGESQRKDGLYMYRYTSEKSGKRETVYGKDLQELRKKEKQIEKDIDDDILTDGSIKKMTVNDLFEKYMQTIDIADTTRVNYVNMWNNYAREEIGNIKVVQLRVSNVKAFYTKMSRAKYSQAIFTICMNQC